MGSRVCSLLVITALTLSGAFAVEGPVQEWELVGKSGRGFFVYVSPDGMSDKFFVAQVLQAVVQKEGKSQILQVMMFDDKRFTPRAFPMSDAQMLHQKAQYNWNPHNSVEQFLWIKVKSAERSPPELEYTEAEIRPGYAE